MNCIWCARVVSYSNTLESEKSDSSCWLSLSARSKTENQLQGQSRRGIKAAAFNIFLVNLYLNIVACRTHTQVVACKHVGLLWHVQSKTLHTFWFFIFLNNDETNASCDLGNQYIDFPWMSPLRGRCTRLNNFPTSDYGHFCNFLRQLIRHLHPLYFIGQLWGLNFFI